VAFSRISNFGMQKHRLLRVYTIVCHTQVVWYGTCTCTCMYTVCHVCHVCIINKCITILHTVSESSRYAYRNSRYHPIDTNTTVVQTVLVLLLDTAVIIFEYVLMYLQFLKYFFVNIILFITLECSANSVLYQ
jgi:hypothetical protein